MKALLIIVASVFFTAGIALADCKDCGCKAKCSETCSCPQKKSDA